jgi:hypothetical protein
MVVTPSQLRADIYRILDQVIDTGVPVEIERRGARLKIVAAEPRNKLDNLEPHPGTILGDPEDLVHLDWSSTWDPEGGLDLP